MRDFRLLALALAIATLGILGCEKPPKDLQPLYCTGGIVRDRGMGDCLSFDGGAGAPDSGIVGKAHFGGARDKVTDFIVRRAPESKSKNSYVLFYNPPPPPYTDGSTEALRNTVAGTLEQDGFWITVTMSGNKTSMRSDAPGAML